MKKEMIMHEVNIMNELHHEKLLNLHEVFDLGKEMCLIEELLVIFHRRLIDVKKEYQKKKIFKLLLRLS